MMLLLLMMMVIVMIMLVLTHLSLFFSLCEMTLRVTMAHA